MVGGGDKTPKNGYTKESEEDIEECIKQDLVKPLVKILLTQGTYPSELRAIVWPKVLNIEGEEPVPLLDDEACQQNGFYRQVKLDVNRSYHHHPPDSSEEERLALQARLTRLIISVLANNQGLYYYQGFHDVCISVLLLMDDQKALQVVNKIARTHLKHFMAKTMEFTKELLSLVYYLLKKFDNELYAYLTNSEVGNIFCLSWVITWFSHVLSNRNDINRLFDLFIASHYLMPFYLTVAILRHKRDEILLEECEMSNMHSYLSQLPETSLPLEELIEQALEMAQTYPPDDIIELARAEKLEEEKQKEREKMFTYRMVRFGERNIIPISVAICLAAVGYNYRKLFCSYLSPFFNFALTDDIGDTRL